MPCSLFVVAALLIATLTIAPSSFACVVGTGTSASCTEAALNACLPGGGSFDGTVTFNCGGAATITVTSAKTISADTIIDGGAVITVTGGGMVSVFSVNSGVRFAVENMTIANGLNGLDSSGAIVNDGNLTVTNSTFSDNTGGAILNEGNLTVTNSTFSGNSGGTASIAAITNCGELVTVNSSTFSDNTAGAIDNSDNTGVLTVADSSFVGNSAYNGGAVIGGGDVTNCIFTANTASNYGGAISGAGNVTRCTFSGNTAGNDGGAIEGGNVANCTFSGNSAGSAGGAIAFPDTVTNSSFVGNSAVEHGGAIYGGGTVVNSTFFGNSVGPGLGGGTSGGGAIWTGSTLTVTDCTFSCNASGVGSLNEGFGGAIAAEGFSSLAVANSTFFSNSASEGGAISNAGTLTVINCTFAGNNVRGPFAAAGGAILHTGADEGTATVTNSILANNTGGNCISAGGGSFTDGGHNIDDGGTYPGEPIVCGCAAAGPRKTTSLCHTNPLLDPAGLANNGGPTETIALQPGSPAINAGDGTVCAAPPVSNLDQRGAVRPGVGATNCSIGAYEFNAAPPASTITNTTSLNICPVNSTTTTTTTTISPTTTSTTITQSPTTTTSTPRPPTTAPNMVPTTTTTTLPCTTARCTLGAALMSPACAGQTIPASVTGKLVKAETLIDQAAATPGKRAHRLRQKAKNILKQAGTKATHAAKGKKAKLTTACAAALKDAAASVAAGL